MAVHLNLLCHASTAAVRSASFPADEPLDRSGREALAAARRHLPHASLCLASPARRALETAEGLGFKASVEPALRDLDYGRWSGLSFRSVQEKEPDALAEWMRDPAEALHGGESVLALMERVAIWLDAQQAARGATLAVTHASFIRAAIVVAIEAGAQSFWRIDVAPLTLARLSGHQRRWNLVSLSPLMDQRADE